MHQRRTWDLSDLSLPYNEAPSFTNIDANSSRSNTRYKSSLASRSSVCQVCTAGWRNGLTGGVAEAWRVHADASRLGPACRWPKGLPPARGPFGCGNVLRRTDISYQNQVLNSFLNTLHSACSKIKKKLDIFWKHLFTIIKVNGRISSLFIDIENELSAQL